MTRAPWSPSNIVAIAPAGPSVRSSTVMPSSALAIVCLAPSILSARRLGHGPSDYQQCVACFIVMPWPEGVKADCTRCCAGCLFHTYAASLPLRGPGALLQVHPHCRRSGPGPQGIPDWCRTYEMDI